MKVSFTFDGPDVLKDAELALAARDAISALRGLAQGIRQKVKYHEFTGEHAVAEAAQWDEVQRLFFEVCTENNVTRFL